MKRTIITLMLLATIATVFGQTTDTKMVPPTTIRRVVGESTVVRDSTGKQVPYAEWKKMQTGGQFILRPKEPIKDGKPNDDPNMEYVIIRTPPGTKITTRTFTTSIRRVINENTVVKDSLGQQYPYSIWHKMQLSGNYTLRPKNPIKDGRPNDDPNMEYILVPLSAQKREEMKKRMGPPPPSPYFTTGQLLKPFNLTDITGKEIGEKEWAGKTVVITFWTIKNDLFLRELPDLNSIAAKYAENPNVVFIAITYNAALDVEEFVNKNPFGFRLVTDERQYIRQFGIRMYPTNLVIDKQGKVLFHSSAYSYTTMDSIEKAIVESDSGKVSGQ